MSAKQTFVNANAIGNQIMVDAPQSNIHFDAAGVVMLFKGFELRSPKDIGDDGSWQRHVVAERRRSALGVSRWVASKNCFEQTIRADWRAD